MCIDLMFLPAICLTAKQYMYRVLRYTVLLRQIVLFLLLMRQIVRFLSIFPLRQIKLFFFSSVRPSTVHKQHVWLMFDTESQLFLTHGQGCGLDSNDGGSLESGPGSWLGDSGYRQEALLERGLGAEGHPQSAQRCISADQEKELQDHGDSIQLHQGNERERQVACGNPASYYDGFRGRVQTFTVSCNIAVTSGKETHRVRMQMLVIGHSVVLETLVAATTHECTFHEADVNLPRVLTPKCV